MVTISTKHSKSEIFYFIIFLVVVTLGFGYVILAKPYDKTTDYNSHAAEMSTPNTGSYRITGRVMRLPAANSVCPDPQSTGIDNVGVTLYINGPGGTRQFLSQQSTYTYQGTPGAYIFNNLPSGSYEVCLSDPSLLTRGACSQMPDCTRGCRYNLNCVYASVQNQSYVGTRIYLKP
jgi:hypothetical protein